MVITNSCAALGKFFFLFLLNDPNTQRLEIDSRIIVGHDGEMGNEPKLMHGDWAKDGSYLVIRKYEQFVPEFNK